MGRESKKALVRVAAGPTEKETLSLDLSIIRVPTLIIWAEQDAFLPPEAAERLKKDLAGHIQNENGPRQIIRTTSPMEKCSTIKITKQNKI